MIVDELLNAACCMPLRSSRAELDWGRKNASPSIPWKMPTTSTARVKNLQFSNPYGPLHRSHDQTRHGNDIFDRQSVEIQKNAMNKDCRDVGKNDLLTRFLERV